MISNILLVDDEAAALKLLADILSDEGYRLRPFNNGELALRSMAAVPPELILLDIHMPGMDGFEVCRRIKANPQLREIPVIFISAATELEEKVRAFQAGGVDYITKPFQKEEVLARVKTHVTLNHSLKEMKRIAEELLKSEANLKIAQAIAHLGHWEWDAHAEQFSWSEEAYRIFGFEPQNFPQDYDTFLRIVHADDRERVADSLKRLQSGSGFDIEYRIVLPDGEVRIVHCKSQLIKLGDDQKPKIFGTVQYFPQHDQATVLGIIQDITEHKKLEWRLEQLANTDALTGCASRRHFLETAEQEILRIHRYGGELSVLALDLDHFKAINDEYGHHAGDLTLKKLVEVCRGLVREVDMIGRLGGEEFAILLPATSCARAFEVAKRMCNAVAAAEVPLPSQTSLRFTTSIGIASFSEGDTCIDGVLSRADKALYEAKKQGRNRVARSCIIDPLVANAAFSA
ncbi:MAG: diguanylate cyclase [Methylococcaceae bacterium]|nr:diguanylate cyclase [Methylococcaceae bacterium]